MPSYDDCKDMVEALSYLHTSKVYIHNTDAEALQIEGGISRSETSFNISLVNEDEICRVLVRVSGHGINDRYYCRTMRSAAEMVVMGYKNAGLLMSKSCAKLQAKMIELMESTCGTSRPIMVSPTASARLILDHLKAMPASELADAIYGTSAPVEAVKPPTYVRPPRYDELFFEGQPHYDTLEKWTGVLLNRPTEGGSNDG